MIQHVMHLLNVVEQYLPNALITNNVPKAVNHVHGNTFTGYVQSLRRTHIIDSVDCIEKLQINFHKSVINEMLRESRINNLLVSFSCHCGVAFFVIVVVFYIYVHALWLGMIHLVVPALAVTIGLLDITTAIEVTYKSIVTRVVTNNKANPRFTNNIFTQYSGLDTTTTMNISQRRKGGTKTVMLILYTYCGFLFLDVRVSRSQRSRIEIGKESHGFPKIDTIS